MNEDKKQGGAPQVAPEMVAEFQAYGGIWKFLAASPHAREQGGDALTKLRMPNGKPLGGCTVECHERVSQFLGVIGRMGAPAPAHGGERDFARSRRAVNAAGLGAFFT